MWETISSVLTSPTSWQVLLTLVVVILMLIIMTKAGMLRIRTRYVSLGESYDEGKKINQRVIRRQIEYAEAFCTNLLADIERMSPELAFGGWKVRCVLEMVYDEIIKWISFNHITDDPVYINNKVAVIRALVMKNDPIEMFKTTEFETKIREWVNVMVKQLVAIREDTYRAEQEKKK